MFLKFILKHYFNQGCVLSHIPIPSPGACDLVPLMCGYMCNCVQVIIQGRHKEHCEERYYRTFLS